MPIQDQKHWYHTKRWERRSRLQMMTEPTCRLCRSKGIITVATVADHVVPVSQGATLQEKSDRMWFGETQSLCAACHALKGQIESKGFHTEISLSGWPTCATHPVYGKRGKG